MSAILDLPEARERIMRWSVKDYERFTELGAFKKNVELIRGIVIEKMSKSPLHVSLALFLYRLMLRLAPPGFTVRHEAPLRVQDSVPEPDIAVVRGSDSDFVRQHPSTAALVVEIAISNIALDRENASLFAEAGVDEYWIVLPKQRKVEIYRQPSEGTYSENFVCTAPAILECSSVAEVKVDLAELFRDI